MAKRTQIVCLCEGVRDSLDSIFVNAFIKAIDPPWLRPNSSQKVRFVPCGSRAEVLKRFPAELRACASLGGKTTLMVIADCDDNCADPSALKSKFVQLARESDISVQLFDQVVFVFPKDRLENWIEFLNTGSTDEGSEGPRTDARSARNAAVSLARRCRQVQPSEPPLPSSLSWSCQNWRGFVRRMTV